MNPNFIEEDVMLFCGIDLHSNKCLVVVSDDADKVVYSKRLPNDLAAICGALSPYQQELFDVVVESTYNWYWLVDGLMAAGHSLHLANTTAIRQYDGLKHRGDESDARHLAHILRLGLLPEGHIMPKVDRNEYGAAHGRHACLQQRQAADRSRHRRHVDRGDRGARDEGQPCGHAGASDSNR
jgi:transposase